MRLLFITQKVHQQDAFAILWVRAFQKLGYDVTVLCLENRSELSAATLGVDEVPLKIVSMGKESGRGKLGQILAFEKAIMTLSYDRVFIHMSPVWGLLGGWWWMIRGTPVYLWYTHYKMQPGVWLLGIYAKRLFCATPQSLPQYPSAGLPAGRQGSGQAASKKVVTGHGIDLTFWPKRPNHCADPHALLGVYRLSRSKRIELPIRAMLLLPEYRFDIYGIEAEGEYVAELKQLVIDLKLSDRVAFHASVPAKDLPHLYSKHRFILNMASETIDKTMLEAMTCGCYPVTTSRNAEAIGLRSESYGRQVGIDVAPLVDSPEAIAKFIRHYKERAPLHVDEMYDVVAKSHSLSALVAKMDSYIREGT